MSRIITVYLAVIIMLVVIVGLGAIRGCSVSNSERGVMKEIADIPPAYTVAPRDLYAAYLNDEEGANVTYGGQVVEIIGIVGGLSHDSNPPFVFFQGRGVWGVRCFTTEEELNKIRDIELPEYKRVILKGRVENRDFHLKVRGCTLEGTKNLAAPSDSGP